MKVDISLMGKGFKVADFKTFLDKEPNFEYTMEIVQEFDELKKIGLGKGKPSPYGFCWVNGITIEQLENISFLLRTSKIEDIYININKKDIEVQTCLCIDKKIIEVAYKIGADIEIVDFK